MITIKQCSQSAQNVMIASGVGFLASWTLTHLTPLLSINPLIGAVSMGIGQVIRETPINAKINKLTGSAWIVNWLAKVTLTAAATTLFSHFVLAPITFEIALISYGKLFLLLQLADYIFRQTSTTNYAYKYAN